MRRQRSRLESMVPICFINKIFAKIEWKDTSKNGSPGGQRYSLFSQIGLGSSGEGIDRWTRAALRTDDVGSLGAAGAELSRANFKRPPKIIR